MATAMMTHHRLKDGGLLAPRMFIRNRMVSTATEMSWRERPAPGPADTP